MENAGFKQSRQSPEHYFNWRASRAVPAVLRVKKIKQLSEARVLDIGCGYGALCSILSDQGAHVTGIEVDEQKLNWAKKFLFQKKDINLMRVEEGPLLPFNDESFDVVFLFDVIEHVNDPGSILKESRRVLKSGGILYVEFTPYYSFTGHHLYDYTKWPVHLLPKDLIKKIVYSKKVKSFITQDGYWQIFESLNKLKISKFQKWVSSLTTIDERYIIKYPDIFELNMPWMKWLGPFKDYFTMSFEGVYLKSKA